MYTQFLAGTPADLATVRKTERKAKTVEQFLASEGKPEAGAVYLVIGKVPTKTLGLLKRLAHRTSAAVIRIEGQDVEFAVRPPSKQS